MVGDYAYFKFSGTPSDGESTADILTAKIEKLQEQITAARVQAASKYAAIESAIDSATDLRSHLH